MSKIIRLSIDNFMRLKAVRINPDGTMNIVEGRNKQGKTSVLRAIAAAFGGADEIPSVPVRKGSLKSKIIAETDDGLIVRRSFTADGGTTLVIEGKDGIKFSSPQAVLNAMTGSLAFDPLEFIRLKPADQREKIRKIAGLDFTALDAKRKAAFDERTNVNREVSRLDAQLLRSMPMHADAPKGPVDVGELVSELRRVEADNQGLSARWQEDRDRRRMAADELANAEREAERLASVIDELERRLALARADAGKQAMRAKEARETIEGFGPEQARPAFTATQPIQEQIVSAELVNRKVRENAARAQAAKAIREQERVAEKLTSEIEACDDEKRLALEAAKFPVAGLSFDDTGVKFDGLPFDQASGAEQLRVSVAIGMASNPKLRVMLIRDSNVLDEEGMELLAMIANENDAQLFVERVSEGDGVGIVIEDGEVVEQAEVDGEQSILPI